MCGSFVLNVSEHHAHSYNGRLCTLPFLAMQIAGVVFLIIIILSIGTISSV